MSCKPSSKEKERTRSLQAVAFDVFPSCRGCSFRSVTTVRFGLKVSYSVIMCPECITALRHVTVFVLFSSPNISAAHFEMDPDFTYTV